MQEQNLLSLSYGRIVRKDINTNEGLLPASFETYQIVESGDVVFRLTDLQNDKRSLRSGLCTERGIITSAYTAVVPNNICPRFFNYLMRSYDAQKVFYSMGGGLRQSLSYADIRRMPIPTPPKQEQRQIVSFLDRETSRIDQLIDRKSNFIQLLTEKRDAAVTNAVTKGLNPQVEMKASEISSIGSVPAHWQLNPIGRALQLTKRIVGDRHDQFALLSLTTRGVIQRDISQNFGKFPESFDSYQVVEPGNFVFCLFDMDETPRTVGLSEKAGMITGAYAVFECTEPAYSKYLLNLFLHLDNCKGLKPFYTGLRKTIRPPRFTSIRIPFPPAIEAREIAEYIERQCSKIDRLVERTRRSIELLREHRSALITAAVTGKIDVRNAA
jgi:type I restriction enzyme, S subunit